MKKFLMSTLLAVCPLFGYSQATTGFHRVNQVIARGNYGVTAQVVPYAVVSVTDTATGLAATIYSDPLLTAQIVPSVVTADASGNYDYYIPLGYCVDETVSSPGSGSFTTPNVCVISGTTTGIINAGTTGQIAYYAANGNVLSGETLVTIAQGGTNAATAAGAWANISAGVGTQTANTVWAGPASGAATLPAFRALVSADIPNNAANTSGNAATASVATTASTAAALFSTPTQCGGGQVATGIAANGDANCTSTSVGITQLSGDAVAGPGSGNQTITFATVNAGPGACGDSTHVCQVTTNGKGLVTSQTPVAIAYATTSRTCNANGCYRIETDGTIEAWGQTTLTSAGNKWVVLTGTFPIAFTTTTNLQVTLSGTVPSPTGDGNPHTASCFILGTPSTSGFSTILGITQDANSGGSGYTDLGAGAYCSWHAIGN